MGCTFPRWRAGGGAHSCASVRAGRSRCQDEKGAGRKILADCSPDPPWRTPKGYVVDRLAHRSLSLADAAGSPLAGVTRRVSDTTHAMHSLRVVRLGHPIVGGAVLSGAGCQRVPCGEQVHRLLPCQQGRWLARRCRSGYPIHRGAQRPPPRPCGKRQHTCCSEGVKPEKSGGGRSTLASAPPPSCREGGAGERWRRASRSFLGAVERPVNSFLYVDVCPMRGSSGSA